jgi:hypothetical protein
MFTLHTSFKPLLLVGKGGRGKIPLKRWLWIARRKLFCPNYVQEISLWKVYARVSVFMIVKNCSTQLTYLHLHSWVLGLILGENGTKTRTQNEIEASIESCRSNNRIQYTYGIYSNVNFMVVKNFIAMWKFMAVFFSRWILFRIIALQNYSIFIDLFIFIYSTYFDSC